MPKQTLLYTDGGARGNPGPAATGVVLKLGEDTLYESKYLGVKTNNQAEYEALIQGMSLAVKHKTEELLCHTDSEVVAKQMRGEYKVHDSKLRKLYAEAKDLEKKFLKVTYNHLPRSNPDIRKADAQVNRTLDEVSR
ncbi:MAG: reverse transcriptase-like protein [Candidatus Altiarchaeales archaeon]|nr:reverse transcriptase-like protein [Candidatus Altiarchaeales archaeon]